ncbi:hypothetical protein C7H19_24900 [Aphanothece hegewaldii CCALA 016]|uniref:DUF4160 domain-containing protein n=2 Tax=Aphanothece TaxID=1121 RepID=A0A2T1LQE6_9CHRO|nr:hypothetical protein C7H19_24900 [Aphanothece hegewaldii CCALA 016]
MIYVCRHALVRIWSNDHLPRHVHVFKGSGECVINLVGKNGTPELREFYELKRSEVVKAIQIVSEYQAQLISEWNKGDVVDLLIGLNKSIIKVLSIISFTFNYDCFPARRMPLLPQH